MKADEQDKANQDKFHVHNQTKFKIERREYDSDDENVPIFIDF